MQNSKVDLHRAVKILGKKDSYFLTNYNHNSCCLELYTTDTYDEVYLTASNQEKILKPGKRTPFNSGDFHCISAFQNESFQKLATHQTTWVFCYNPKGGNKNSSL